MSVLNFGHADATRGPSVAVIAEIGVNHDGSVDVAKRLIDESRQARADAVKFQCFDPATLLSGDGALAAYQQGKSGNARELLGGLRLSPDDLQKLRAYCASEEMSFVVTPFSLGDVAVLRDLEVDAVKIASPDAVNPLLLEASAELGKPILVSTGTCDLDELGLASDLLRKHKAGGAMLHCVSAYPTPVDQAGLGGIAALRAAFDLPVGYSDHTGSLDVGAWAVMAGACVLEKHVTHDRGAAGPDHAASLEPADLATYIAHAKRAATAMGPLVKQCTEVERDVRRVSRQSLAYAKDLPAGHVLKPGDLETRRPGTGIPAAEAQDWFGRTLARDVVLGTLVQHSDANHPAR